MFAAQNIAVLIGLFFAACWYLVTLLVCRPFEACLDQHVLYSHT